MGVMLKVRRARMLTTQSRPNCHTRCSCRGQILIQTHCREPSSHTGWSCCAHGGGGGGGGIHSGAYGGAYAGRGVHHTGGAGGGLHSLVQTLRDQFGSHCAELVTQCVHTVGSHSAELIAGVATVTAANGTNATAIVAARRRTKRVIAQPPQRDPCPPWVASAYAPRHAAAYAVWKLAWLACSFERG